MHGNHTRFGCQRNSGRRERLQSPKLRQHKPKLGDHKRWSATGVTSSQPATGCQGGHLGEQSGCQAGRERTQQRRNLFVNSELHIAACCRTKPLPGGYVAGVQHVVVLRQHADRVGGRSARGDRQKMICLSLGVTKSCCRARATHSPSWTVRFTHPSD